VPAILKCTFGPGENQLQLTDGYQENRWRLSNWRVRQVNEKYLGDGAAFWSTRAWRRCRLRIFDHLGWLTTNQPLEEQRRSVMPCAYRLFFALAPIWCLICDNRFSARDESLVAGCHSAQDACDGAASARHGGEDFRAAYELPNVRLLRNLRGYWSGDGHRMPLLTGDARYADVLERAFITARCPACRWTAQSTFTSTCSKRRHYRRSSGSAARAACQTSRVCWRNCPAIYAASDDAAFIFICMAGPGHNFELKAACNR